MRHRRRSLALLLMVMLAPCPLGAAQSSPLDELMQRLAAVPERQATFEEEKTFGALTQTLRSNGTLRYRRPSHLEKITYPPHPKSLVVDDGRLVLIEGDQPPRSVDLESQPELGALVDAVRGTLAGDLTALRRNYTVTMQGDLAGWRLTLTPANQRVARFLREVDIEGAGTEPRSVRIVQANGDQSLMTIHPRS